MTVAKVNNPGAGEIVSIAIELIPENMTEIPVPGMAFQDPVDDDPRFIQRARFREPNEAAVRRQFDAVCRPPLLLVDSRYTSTKLTALELENHVQHVLDWHTRRVWVKTHTNEASMCLTRSIQPLYEAFGHWFLPSLQVRTV